MLSFIVFCAASFVCIIRRAEGGFCLLSKELRLRAFQRVDFVLSLRVEGGVKLF